VLACGMFVTKFFFGNFDFFMAEDEEKIEKRVVRGNSHSKNVRSRDMFKATNPLSTYQKNIHSLFNSFAMESQ
jgi:hypothetical protein